MKSEQAQRDSGKVRRYETVVVLSPEAISGTKTVESLTADVKGILERYGAEEIQLADWGRKEMAFESHRQKAGHYLSFEYTTTKGITVSEVTAQLRLREEIILFQTHKLEKGAVAMVPSDSRFRGNNDDYRGAGDDRGGYGGR